MNVKEMINGFNEIYNGAVDILKETTNLIAEYDKYPWGEGTNAETITNTDQNIKRYRDLLVEARVNLENTRNELNNAHALYKSKSMRLDDFNWKIIELTQNIAGYIEYISTQGMGDIQNAHMVKLSTLSQQA